MGFPFELPAGVTVEDLWAWMVACHASLGYNEALKMWFAADDIGHVRGGNSAEEAVYMCMIAGLENIYPKSKTAA